MTEYKIDVNQLEFAVFCIESIANKLNKDSEAVYTSLKDSDVLYGYIVPNYEVLHTQGKDYIVDDILDYIEEKGIKL